MHFAYKAKDSGGRTVEGVAEAADEQSLVALLHRRDLVVLSVSQERRKRRLPDRWQKKVRLDELVVFSRQLAALIDAGIPLVQSLNILFEQTESGALKNVIGDVERAVETGSNFSDALGRHQAVFSPLFISLVRAGEASGVLDQVLDRIATHLEKMDSLRRKVRSSLMYPAVVTVVAVAVVIVLMVKVIPGFQQVYQGLGAQLPRPTEVMISVSVWLAQWVLYLVGGMAVCFVLLRGVPAGLVPDGWQWTAGSSGCRSSGPFSARWPSPGSRGRLRFL